MRRVFVAALAAVVVVCLGAGCAKDVRTSYPARAPGQAVGSVTVALTRAAKDVSVVVNGALVAEAVHTRKVTVTGVPAGPAQVQVAMGGGAQSRVEAMYDVEVEPYADTAVVVAAPEVSTAAALYWGLYNLGSFVFAGMLWTAVLL